MVKKIQARERVRAIMRSHVPLKEDYEAFESVRLKVDTHTVAAGFFLKCAQRLLVYPERLGNGFTISRQI